MGSFKATCSLSNDVIAEGDEIVLVLLTRKNGRGSLVCYNWDNYAPVPMLIEGTYNGYGGLDNARLLNTNSKASEEVITYMNKKLFEILKKETEADTSLSDDEIETLSDLINSRDWSFVKRSPKLALLQAMVKTLEGLKHNQNEELFENMELMLSSLNLGVENLKEAQEKLEELKAKTDMNVHVPIQFVLLKKEVVNHILDNFGTNSNNEEDYYQVKLQKKRHGKVKFVEEMDNLGFYTGTKDYAGNNQPAFSWHNLHEAIKQEKPGDKIKNQVEEYYVKQVLAFALINHYMDLLGKPWHPSMTVNDEIKYYGHTEAFELQKELLNLGTHKKFKP